MERYKAGENRDQISLIPLNLDDMIGEENPVRAIDAIVENMDVPSLGFKYSQTATTGRKPYSPVDMFKLYTYSYFNGIRSSRKIERECGRNIEVMWLIGGLAPDFKTIADFRKENKEAIKRAFSRFSLLCDGLGLIGKEIIAVDGSKFRANNSCNRYYTLGKTKKLVERYEEQAKKYLALLDVHDEEEKHTPPPHLNRENIGEKLAGIKEKIAKLQEQLAVLEADGDIAATDPDSKRMPMRNKGYDICYNVQTAVDAKSHLIVAVDITSSPLDKEQLFHMSELAKEELGVKKIQVVADRGYYSTKQFKLCAENNITAIVPKPIHLGTAKTAEYAKEYFQYDLETDTYTCPAGQTLYHTKKRPTSKRLEERYVNRSACLQCIERDKCTAGEFRSIVEKQFERFADEVDLRTAQNRDLVLRRQCLVEHPFGTVKHTLGFTYFLTRRTESVRAESFLHFLIYNIKRVINIMGTGNLIGHLAG